MIVDLPDTTASKVSKALVRIREEGGAVALGRVLTLVISTATGHEEEAIEAANDASREHPMRVIVFSKSSRDPGQPVRLDAQIRVGGDAGASEVVVLRLAGAASVEDEGLLMALLLPDAPVVAWWPTATPERVSVSALGKIAQSRITDAAAQADPTAFLKQLSRTYAPGDTDFAWTRLTLWRTQLAAVLDQPPFEPITGVAVRGSADSPSTLLLAAWLRMQLRVPVEYTLTNGDGGHAGIHQVILHRESGEISLERNRHGIATLTQPGQPRHDISLPRRTLRDCLAEELRRLDPDVLYGEVITRGLTTLLNDEE